MLIKWPFPYRLIKNRLNFKYFLYINLKVTRILAPSHFVFLQAECNTLFRERKPLKKLAGLPSLDYNVDASRPGSIVQIE